MPAVVPGEAIAALPKVELHVHLEGSMRPSTVLALAERNGVDLGVDSEAELAERYRFRDFLHFIELFRAGLTVLRTPERELALVTQHHGVDVAGLVALQRRAMAASFAPPELRAAFESELDAWESTWGRPRPRTSRNSRANASRPPRLGGPASRDR